ncbi:MAG: hypothetical protein LiPW31_111 [Microgenomates group bacterium LiPW_31]|nr:MAG: hypothetical protein LiPW31_111 [Microgenomates group bacterium LiPW_31]
MILGPITEDVYVARIPDVDTTERRASRITHQIFISILRRVLFIVVSLFLRWLIWCVLGLLRIFKPFNYLFLVYPGTDSDLDGYCPRRLAKSWLFSKKPAIGGIISKSVGGRGLILVVPNTIKEFLFHKDVCEKVMQRLERIKAIVGAKSIAIAGQVPGMLSRHNLFLEKPFVRGNKGTVFCIMETVSEVMKKHNLEPGKFRIILIGVGYVGALLLSSLKEQGHNIVGVDIQINRKGIFLPEESRPFLKEADMVIVLTPRGSDFAPYTSDLKTGAIVIDDTHPKITQRPIGVNFYKVAVGLDGVKFYPHLPGYRAEWIPGCAVEAIYSAATGQFNGSSQQEFNKRAKELGFFAHLVS